MGAASASPVCLTNKLNVNIVVHLCLFSDSGSRPSGKGSKTKVKVCNVAYN